jgi:predicted metalloprotease with PDZ domain
MGFMIRLALVLVLTLLAPAQEPQAYGISYRLAMSRPASHLFEVTIDVSVPAGEQAAFVDFQMPKWQPGRYSVADFAKNVQEFTAQAQDHPLQWMKIDDQTWRVQRQGNRSITATYKMFGDDLSGTYGQLDVGHASYTGGEIFMYIAGHKPDPVELHIEPPQKWRVINGRTERPNQVDWKYPDYELMIDNPTEIGPDWTLDEFKVDGRTYRVMVHSRGDEGGRRPAFVRDVEKIVRAEVAMWGRPEFDTYTFMYHFAADDRSSDGMEHLTSTQIIEPGILAERSTYDGALATTAHEFFHAWNVKRLRPIELGPWDWTRPAATRGLWIAEGFTQYYGIVLFHRAGFEDSSGFLRDLGYTISTIENSPASKLMSAEESSMAAPFIDAALSRQRTNLSNTSFSYYLKGELIALNLDLIIRGKTNGRRSLDDVMRRAYDEFYVKSPNAGYYLKGRGYRYRRNGHDRLLQAVHSRHRDAALRRRILIRRPASREDVGESTVHRRNRNRSAGPAGAPPGRAPDGFARRARRLAAGRRSSLDWRDSGEPRGLDLHAQSLQTRGPDPDQGSPLPARVESHDSARCA